MFPTIVAKNTKSTVILVKGGSTCYKNTVSEKGKIYSLLLEDGVKTNNSNNDKYVRLSKGLTIKSDKIEFVVKSKIQNPNKN